MRTGGTEPRKFCLNRRLDFGIKAGDGHLLFAGTDSPYSGWAGNSQKIAENVFLGPVAVTVRHFGIGNHGMAAFGLY